MTDGTRVIDRLIAGLRGDREVITDPSSLRKGKAAVRGALRANDALESPLNSRPCAAFYYKATYQAPSRLQAYIRRKLRDALVYGSELHLELGDAQLELRPKAPERFTRADHLALKAEDIDGFVAREQIMRQGADVVAYGVLKRKGERWYMLLDHLELTPEEEERAKTRKSRNG